MTSIKYLYQMACLTLFLLINMFTAKIVWANELPQCNTLSDYSLNLTDALAGFKKKQSKSSNYSTEGAELEYYYSEDDLKGIKVFIYGETMKSEITYLLTSISTYAVEIKDYYYNLPIYSDNHFVASTNESKLFVCNNELVGSLNDQTVITHFESASNLLKDILLNLTK